MNKKNNMAFFYIFIVSVFLLFSGLFLLLMWGVKENDRLYIRYSMEKTVSDFMAAMSRGDLESFFAESSGVKGFGVYSSSGEAISFVGEGPRRIEIQKVQDRKELFFYDSSERTFTLIRPFGPMGMMDRRGPGRHKGPDKEGMFRPPPPDGSPGRPHLYVFIEVYARKYYNYLRRLFTVISFLIPLVFLGILVAFAWVYRKSVLYKKRMEEREKLASLGEVSRTLSHEIKNPLGAIRIQSAYLKKIIASEHKQELSVIDHEVERLTLLTNRIGDFLRDPLGSPSEIEIISFLKDLASKYSDPVDIKESFEEKMFIFFDYHRLRSICENIIQNGLESYPDEETGKSVTVRIKRDRNHCIIRVTDRGRGLPEQFEKRIYDPYFTTKTKGSGIGLAITKRFIEAAGGSINFEREKEGGTTVQIVFKIGRKNENPGC